MPAQGRQAVLQAKRWLPDRRLVAIADAGFSGVGLIGALRRHACLVTRLRIDANLFAPASPRRPGQMGRPRLKGRRLPTFKAVLADPATAWSRVTVTEWYGGRSRELEVASDTAVWNYSGLPPAPIRWVLVRDPSGEREPQAFLSTDLAATPERILGWFVSRCSMETTFQEMRAHLGVEMQRQWSDLAILRTTPALLGLFSLVMVWADELARAPASAIRPRTAACYSKREPTFSDAIAAVHRALWCPSGLSMPHPSRETVEIPAASPPLCCKGSRTTSATQPKLRKIKFGIQHRKIAMGSSDPVIERIAAYAWPRGGVEARQVRGGYTLGIRSHRRARGGPQTASIRRLPRSAVVAP